MVAFGGRVPCVHVGKMKINVGGLVLELLFDELEFSSSLLTSSSHQSTSDT